MSYKLAISRYNPLMPYEQDNFQFELHPGGTASLIKYRGGEAMPVVPAQADGHTVTCVESWAFGKFLGKRPILGVTLPDGLTDIGEYAFSNCKKLSNIDIPLGVKSIGAAAFSGCAALLRASLPPGLTEISEWLFKDCQSLREIKIPVGVMFVGKGAFSGCKSLTEIFLPDDIASVEFETFRDCRSLAVFDLPPAVTRINDGAFKGCHALSHLTVPERVTYIGWQDVFPPGTIIHAAPGSYAEAYAKTKRLPLMLLDIPGETETDMENPPHAIPERAFADNLALTEAVIPEGTNNIGNGAYSGCALLSRAALPESLLTIGIDAFAGTALTDITIPAGVVKIGWNAFPPGITLRGETGGCAEEYAKRNQLNFIPMDAQHVPVNKSMKEVLQSVLNIAGREAFGNERLFKNLLSDLLPGPGKNAGARNVLYAAVSECKVLNAVFQDDAAATNRFAAQLMDLGYRPQLAREAAVCFWAVLCYPKRTNEGND